MRTALHILLALALVALAVNATIYVCPMADHPKEYDKPGTCPLCGMTLVEKDSRLRVAVVLFNYAEDIDFTAPIEVFGQSDAQVFTVAATTEPISTVWGLHIRPDYDLAHAPASDVILIPGGGVNNALQDDQIVNWIRQRAPQAKYVVSVCNGAFILAKTGLLDGLTATTTAGRIEQLAQEYSKIHVVRERVVDNGKFITAGGLSSGIDGALHVVERQHGRARAEDVARRIEYKWEPESKWSRAQLADLRLPDVKLRSDAQWKPQASSGDTRQWSLTGHLHIAMTSDEFLDYATKDLATKGWKLRDHADGKRTYERTDLEGGKWLAELRSESDGDTGLKETMSVRAVQ
ncbi:MAG TPA: DJ-1/PfpI family protein [Thermoanaerobaculia bacterium]